MPSTHLTLTPADHVEPCPFCGSTEVELLNTHTACYWIACPCGAEVHGEAFAKNVPSNKKSLRSHQRAKRSALDAWNRRTEGARITALREAAEKNDGCICGGGWDGIPHARTCALRHDWTAPVETRGDDWGGDSGIPVAPAAPGGHARG